MVTLGILIGIAVALFLAAFISKRRFGLLGLALTAGATLSVIWDDNAELIVSMLGVLPEGAVTKAVTLSVLVLLPAILLLFHGHKYKTMTWRVIGALLFTVLAAAFLIEPVGHALLLEGGSLEAYNWLVINKELLISAGVILSVIDLFFTKPAKAVEKDGKKK